MERTSIPILRTKLYIPPVRAELVARQRLVDHLMAGLDRKLTLISAPAGFGKTTLLSDWIRSSQSPVAWISLDKGDNDPARFLAYFVAALQSIEREIGADLLGALQSPQPPPLQALLTGLINDITALPSPVIVILDDFQFISADQVHDALIFIIENQPSQLHLIISTRVDPPWPLARLRARGEMSELRANQLRFTFTETAEFMHDVMGLILPTEGIAALERRTEGWIAGLQMAALSMKGQTDFSAFIDSFTGSHRFVLDYLLEEVLDRQPSHVREFLLKTSILDRLSVPLCNAITGRVDSQKLLNQLDRANLFLVPLDDERNWYRYHHLFSDLLRTQMQDTLPEQVSSLHALASQWYEEEDLIEEAVDHALAGNDIGRATLLVERNAMQMIAQSKLTTLSRWFEGLPGEIIQARPWLCVYHAWTSYWTGMREGGEDCLDNAELALSAPLPSRVRPPSADVPILTESERQLLTGQIAAIRAFYAFTNGDIPLVLEMGRKALALLPEDDYMYSLAALILGGAYWSTGDAAASEQAQTRAMESAQRSGYRFLAVSAAAYTGTQQAKQARLRDAYDTYTRALKLGTEPGGRTWPVAGFPLTKLGDLWREWNDLEAASRNLHKGIDLCERWGQPDVLSEGYVFLARLYVTQGEFQRAGGILHKAEQLALKTKVDPWIKCWLDDCRLRLWLYTGDLPAAIDWAKKSGLSADDELSYLHDLHHINLARVLVTQGIEASSQPHLDQATALLTRLLEAAEKARWYQEAIKILLLQALALQARGDHEVALNALFRALVLAEPGGYMRTFIDEGDLMHLLIGDFRVRIGKYAQGLDKKQLSRLRRYADKILAGFSRTLPTRHTHPGRADEPRITSQPPGTIDPLSQRELEVLQLLKTNLTVPEIADKMYVSVNTARTHVKSIYNKLDVHNRLDAIRAAEELGL